MCKNIRSYSSLILNLGPFNTRFREVSLLLTLCSPREMLFHRRLSTSPTLITYMLILEPCWISLTPVFSYYVSTMEARCVDYLKSRLSLSFFSERMVDFFLVKTRTILLISSWIMKSLNPSSCFQPHVLFISTIVGFLTDELLTQTCLIFAQKLSVRITLLIQHNP